MTKGETIKDLLLLSKKICHKTASFNEEILKNASLSIGYINNILSIKIEYAHNDMFHQGIGNININIAQYIGYNKKKNNIYFNDGDYLNVIHFF